MLSGCHWYEKCFFLVCSVCVGRSGERQYQGSGWVDNLLLFPKNVVSHFRAFLFDFPWIPLEASQPSLFFPAVKQSFSWLFFFAMQRSFWNRSPSPRHRPLVRWHRSCCAKDHSCVRVALSRKPSTTCWRKSAQSALTKSQQILQ